jgi:hypothetical protein
MRRHVVVSAALAACTADTPVDDGDSGDATATPTDTTDDPSVGPSSADDDDADSMPGDDDDADSMPGDDDGTTSDDSADASSDGGTTGWTPPADCGGGALADLTAEIAVGEFVPLATDGLTSDLIDAGGGHHILQYSDKGVWDPNTCQALFTGGGHLSLTKFIGYSASENTWFQAPNPSWWCPIDPDDPYACATHAYGQNALNPATGDYWFRRFNDANVHHTSIASPISAQWDAAPELPGGPASCIATALEYFPDMGGLVYVDCAGQTVLVAYDGAATWETLPGTYPMGGYHNYGVYSQPRGQVLFGAGNGSYELYLLSPDGTADPIAPPPRTFHPSPDDPSTFRILTADPISGRFLAYAPIGDLFEYDAESDEWTQLSDQAPENLQIAIPVSTYGVILFLSTEPQMYVYRHVAP